MKMVLLCCAFTFAAQKPAAIKMATTTSTENSGLLDVLLPAFAKKTGITVHVIAVGSGRAIKLGENGDVDLIFVHARAAEDRFVENGFGVNRKDVMYNDFIIVGPKTDPAGIAKAASAHAALKKIAIKKAVFVSRGDESGTHMKEKALWQKASVAPTGKWYLEAGQGMEAVLIMANEKMGYALTDRGTYIAAEDKLELAVLFEKDLELFNPYGVIAVNPEKHKDIKYKEAMTFIDWIVTREAQDRIAGFTKNGKQLFFPNAQPESKQAKKQ